MEPWLPMDGAMDVAAAIDAAMAMEGAKLINVIVAIDGGVAFDGYQWSHGDGRCHGRCGHDNGSSCG